MDALISRQITGQGTPESQWQPWLAQSHLPEMSAEPLLEGCSRVVIVSPHPDDEVLATASILLHCAHSAMPCVVVAVTSGEASHPGSKVWHAQKLSRTREQESARALALLCPDSQTIHLRIPDGDVIAQKPHLLAALRQTLRPSDAVFCPWRCDGHPDHEATGEACAIAAADAGSRLLELPIWAWHWAGPGDSRIPWHRAVRIPMTAAQQALKREALSCFSTQLLPDMSTGRPAVLPPWATARLLRAFEVVLR